MNTSPKKPTGAKLSISLSHAVYAWAVQLAEKKGFDNNFSAYIADLIRRDREREESRAGYHMPESRAPAFNEPAPPPYKTRKP